MRSNPRLSRTTFAIMAVLFSLLAAASLQAADANDAAPPKLTAELFTGEYVGTFIAADGNTLLGVAKVYFDPKVDPTGGFRAVVYAVKSGLLNGAVISEKTECESSTLLTGTMRPPTAKEPNRRQLRLASDKVIGVVEGDKCLIWSEGGKFDLTRYRRKSATLGAASPAGAVVLLGGKAGKAPSLGAWTNDKWKAFDDGSMMVGDGNNYTVRKFKNFRLHAEFAVVHGKGGGGGNSGFYLLDRYEVQVYDSFGREPRTGSCAAIYKTFAPSANACLPP